MRDEQAEITNMRDSPDRNQAANHLIFPVLLSELPGTGFDLPV